MLEGRRVRALLHATATGASAPSRATTGGVVAARAVILATGGAAALWSRTTNPPGSYGSGLLLARAAGADLADLEFVQFHPTAVAGIPGREGFLVTEAVRGEGATLHDAAGERFVDELQPRDAVARAIHRLLAETGAPAVFLDMTAIDPARFPNVVAALREAGLDPATERDPGLPREPLRDGRDRHRPARPQHGRRRSTRSASARAPGLHGANRLASNSLSECFVFGHRAALAGARRARAAGGRRARRPPDADLAPAAVARDARRRCGATPGSSATPAGCAGCSTTRIRSPGSSRPPRSRARRAAARTRARTSRARTPSSTAATASSRPARDAPCSSSGRERSALNLNSTCRRFGFHETAQTCDCGGR